MLTTLEVAALAEAAHDGQFDKIGAPYIDHVRAVSAGVTRFGSELEMAGLLHDIVEDTRWTAEALREAGVPDRVVAIVQAVTNVPGEEYQAKMRRITADPDALLIKIADNAHNTRPDRTIRLPIEKQKRFSARYEEARATLWSAASPDKVGIILKIVNPALLPTLELHRSTRTD